MGAVARTIHDKLSAAFSPSVLEVVDDSDRHKGHAGAREGGESHFNVVIEAARFEELAGPVHALSIVARAPGEG
jgi:BolA protein